MNNNIKSYKDLIVWQKSMSLVEQIYLITKKFPKEELNSLTNQLRRAAVSIPSNIAEGHNRYYTGEYKHFLLIAQGSPAELETQVTIASMLGYISENETNSILEICQEISKMIFAICKKIGLETKP